VFRVFTSTIYHSLYSQVGSTKYPESSTALLMSNVAKADTTAIQIADLARCRPGQTLRPYPNATLYGGVGLAVQQEALWFEGVWIRIHGFVM